jgi:DNA helicase TIP49 (TBP-interacting protein)
MPFSKSFPKQSKTSTYPQWEEVTLTDAEEKLEEDKAKHENIKLMKECVEDTKALMQEKNLKDYQTDLINVAVALFEKRASHSVYWKESKAKEKFDEMFNK